ncbi:MAG: hypothetical protein EXQ56_11695 [Acidobacteria bacterium]|nr:hypothetical protein [Acidobacteriota bacterium]
MLKNRSSDGPSGPEQSNTEHSGQAGQARLRELRVRHPRFHYDGFQLSHRPDEATLRVEYRFRLEPDIVFTPKLKIQGVDTARFNRLPREALDNFFFHIGLVEMLSYWKAAAPAEIVVHAGVLNAEQIEWWLDLLRRGMGEFFYVNQLDWRAPEFVRIVINASAHSSALISAATTSSVAIPTSSVVIQSAARDLLSPSPGEEQKQVPRRSAPRDDDSDNGGKDLVLASGGKDTVVTLETMRAAQREGGRAFDCLLLNPTKAALAVVAEAGCTEPIVVRRSIDPKLLALNQDGYLNGHTPFSALLAFLGTAVAALFGHGRVIVSNERSAEEPGVEYLDHPINHQYSKTFEFEGKFRAYAAKYLPVGDAHVEYVSLLRPLFELQIAERFARYPQYFQHFRSCNRGQADNSWCGRCPKCLFVYVVLGPFLDHGQLIAIFGTDPCAQPEAAEILRTLLGMDRAKPFECVGTREETVAALFLTVKHFRDQGIALPAALREISDTILDSCTNPLEVAQRVMAAHSDDHFVPDEIIRRLRR